MNVGTYLTRKSDGVGAVVTEVAGGSRGWLTLTLETGRTVHGTSSRNGVPSEYVPVNDRANVIAQEIATYRGLAPGTVALATRLSYDTHDEIATALGDNFLAMRVIDALEMSFPSDGSEE